MNEQRNNKMRYLSGNMVSSLEQDWQDLLARLQSLMQTAKNAFRADLVKLIISKENVLIKNNPNKKIYRSILKFADDIENKINSSLQRIRNF